MNSNKNEKIITLDIFLIRLPLILLRNKSAQNGIDSFLEDKKSIGLNPLGTIELMVSSKNLEKSFEILSN